MAECSIVFFSKLPLNEMSFQEEKKKVANKCFSAENGWLRSDDDGSSNLGHESLIHIPLL